MSESKQVKVTDVVNNYYAGLRNLASGVDGLYRYGGQGTSFAFSIGDFNVVLTLDGRLGDGSLGGLWDAIIRGERNLEVGASTGVVQPAVDAFCTVATRYYEEKPIGIHTNKDGIVRIGREYPAMREIPPELNGEGYVSFRANLDEARRALIDAEIPFAGVSVLEIPKFTGPTLDSTTFYHRRSGPVVYTARLGLMGPVNKLVEYAETLDRALGVRPE